MSSMIPETVELAGKADQSVKISASRAKSNANLIHWVPGQSGNPKGRPAAGASQAEWINELDTTNADGSARYSVDAITKIAGDMYAQPSKRKAAQIHLRGEALGFNSTGRPYAGDDLDRISDRTVGKPMQSIQAQILTQEVKRIVLVDEVMIGGTARVGIVPLVDCANNIDADKDARIKDLPGVPSEPSQPCMGSIEDICNPRAGELSELKEKEGLQQGLPGHDRTGEV